MVGRADRPPSGGRSCRPVLQASQVWPTRPHLLLLGTAINSSFFFSFLFFFLHPWAADMVVGVIMLVTSLGALIAWKPLLLLIDALHRHSMYTHYRELLVVGNKGGTVYGLIERK